MVDWRTVQLDPKGLTDCDREGFEHLAAFLAAKVAQMPAPRMGLEEVRDREGPPLLRTVTAR
jgi:hypothetical protein